MIIYIKANFINLTRRFSWRDKLNHKKLVNIGFVCVILLAGSFAVGTNLLSDD